MTNKEFEERLETALMCTFMDQRIHNIHLIILDLIGHDDKDSILGSKNDKARNELRAKLRQIINGASVKDTNGN